MHRPTACQFVIPYCVPSHQRPFVHKTMKSDRSHLRYAHQYLKRCTSDPDLLTRTEVPSRWSEVRHGWERLDINSAAMSGLVLSPDGLQVMCRYLCTSRCKHPFGGGLTIPGKPQMR